MGEGRRANRVRWILTRKLGGKRREVAVVSVELDEGGEGAHGSRQCLEGVAVGEQRRQLVSRSHRAQARASAALTGRR